MKEPMDDKTVAKMRQMRAEGMRPSAIARELGCSHSTVSRYTQDVEVAPAEPSNEETPPQTQRSKGLRAELEEAQGAVAYYEQRERELLELIAALSAENVNLRAAEKAAAEAA